MFKLTSILITIGIVLFMLINCHNKTSISNNTINRECKHSADTIDNILDFINAIAPQETIVEEIKMKGKELIKSKNEKIKVYLLVQDTCSKHGFLKTEIINNTNDTIFYINNTFLYYKESDGSWRPLVYPNNNAKNDIGYSIPPQRDIQIKFFLPPQEEYHKGKYKLQLIFQSASKDTYYYIDKLFLHTAFK